MIRPFTCLCLLFAAGSGLFLYNSKHSAQMLDQDIARIAKTAQENRARAALLRAEYDRLGDPERLKELTGQVLTLAPTDPKQFASLADLEKRLPAVAPPPVLVPELPPTPVLVPELASAPIADKPVIERPAPQALAMVSHPAIIPAPHPVQPTAQPPLISQAQAATPVQAPVVTPKPTPLHPVADTKPAAPRPPVAAPTVVAAARPRPPAPAPTPAPAQASDIVARLVRNVPSDPPTPMVASALGMARTMMPQPFPARP